MTHDDQKTGSWEIPDGITVNFNGNSYIEGGTLTINGHIHLINSNSEDLFRCDIVIGPTCKFSDAPDTDISTDEPNVTYAHVYVKSGKTMYVQKGATMNAQVYLAGTLTGESTLSNRVSLKSPWNEPSYAVISGTLTFTRDLDIVSYTSDRADSHLTIPEGSYITLDKAAEFSGMDIGDTTVYLNGTVDCKDGSISVGKGGKLELNGKVILHTYDKAPCTTISTAGFFEYEEGHKFTYDEVAAAFPSPVVVGDGTISFIDTVHEKGQEYGQLMRSWPCDTDDLIEIASDVRNDTYDPNSKNFGYGAHFTSGMHSSWLPALSFDLKHLNLEFSWGCAHLWDKGVYTVPKLTYSDTGEITYTCTKKCGATKVKVVEGGPHTIEDVPRVEPTCTTDGHTIGKRCTVCDAYPLVPTVIPALGHLWSSNNCAEAAVCTREDCGATREASEHVWGDWTVTKDATCTETGSRTHTCTSCNATESETIPVRAHDYTATIAAPTCTEKGYTKHTCSRCNSSYTDSYTDMLEHSWDEGIITTEPTADAPGVKTFTCKRCRATKTEAVSNLVQQEVSWMPAGPITVTYGDFAYTRPTAYNDSVEDCTFTYSSSNPAVATVDANDKTTIVGAGTTVITATAPAVPGKFAETSASYTLNVNKAALTVTANNHTIAYGLVPDNNGYRVSGLVNGDTESVLTGTAAYTYGYEQYGKLGTYDNYAVWFEHK